MVYFWAFLVSVLLFTVGGVFSIYEGAHKLSAPAPLAWPGVAIGVLLVAIVLESFSLAGCVREIRKVARGRSLWRFFRESRNTELIVVLGEDIAALLGLVFALVAVVLAFVTGNPVFDAAGSIAVGVLLIVVAVLLAVEIKALITGQSAEPAVEGEMRAFLAGTPRSGRSLLPADPADGRWHHGCGEGADGGLQRAGPGGRDQPGGGRAAAGLPGGALDVLRTR